MIVLRLNYNWRWSSKKHFVYFAKTDCFISAAHLLNFLNSKNVNFQPTINLARYKNSKPFHTQISRMFNCMWITFVSFSLLELLCKLFWLFLQRMFCVTWAGRKKSHNSLKEWFFLFIAHAHLPSAWTKLFIKQISQGASNKRTLNTEKKKQILFTTLMQCNRNEFEGIHHDIRTVQLIIIYETLKWVSMQIYCHLNGKFSRNKSTFGRNKVRVYR